LSAVSPAAWIFAITIVVSLLGLFSAPQIVQRSLLRPYHLVRNREYHRLVTSGFVHADLNHLIFNMITFWFFSFTLERVIGGARFVALYFIGMVLSEIGTCIKHRNNPSYASLGASGAILAVLFACIVYFPDQNLYLMFAIPIPAPLFAVGYLAYSVWSSRHARDRINHDAHLGGALTGLAFVAVTDPGAYGRLGQILGI
jgi:membrane associated rhomboid family serine protease